MDVMNLKYFETVAREGHMGRAAEKLHITQPSLSAAIRRLETEIGYQLFDRVGKNIVLNEYGRIYLRGVTSALLDLQTSLDEMQAYQKNTEGLVTLSCSTSRRNSKLIDHLLGAGFFLRISDIPKDLENALNERESDLIITMGRSLSSYIEHDELAVHELVFVAGKSHPLVGYKGRIELPVLRHQLFCSTDTPNSLLNVFCETYGPQSFRPSVAFYGRNSSDLMKAVSSGKYIGLMVKEFLPDTDDIRVLDVSGQPFKVSINLYWRKGQGIESAVQAVRHEIIDFYADYDDDVSDMSDL